MGRIEDETIEILFIGFPPGAAPPAGRAFFHFRPGQTVKHLAEKAGVPHTEIGRVEAGGASAGLGYIPAPGESVSVFPKNRRLGRGEPTPAFLLDVHLGKLARHLRLLGFDAAYRNDLGDEEIVRRSAAEGRTILSRDRGLLSRQAVGAGYLVRSGDPFRQTADVVRDFGLQRRTRPFSRCARCGGLLERAEKSDIAAALPEGVRRRYRRFLRCPACGQVYWRGDHFRNIESFIRRLRAETGSRGSGGGAD